MLKLASRCPGASVHAIQAVIELVYILGNRIECIGIISLVFDDNELKIVFIDRHEAENDLA